MAGVTSCARLAIRPAWNLWTVEWVDPHARIFLPVQPILRRRAQDLGGLDVEEHADHEVSAECAFGHLQDVTEHSALREAGRVVQLGWNDRSRDGPILRIGRSVELRRSRIGFNRGISSIRETDRNVVADGTVALVDPVESIA